MRGSVAAMGISMHMYALDLLVYARPNALGAQWQLKLGIPLAAEFLGHHDQESDQHFH